MSCSVMKPRSVLMKHPQRPLLKNISSMNRKEVNGNNLIGKDLMAKKSSAQLAFATIPSSSTIIKVRSFPECADKNFNTPVLTIESGGAKTLSRDNRFASDACKTPNITVADASSNGTRFGNPIRRFNSSPHENKNDENSAASTTAKVVVQTLPTLPFGTVSALEQGMAEINSGSSSSFENETLPEDITPSNNEVKPDVSESSVNEKEPSSKHVPITAKKRMAFTVVPGGGDKLENIDHAVNGIYKASSYLLQRIWYIVFGNHLSRNDEASMETMRRKLLQFSGYPLLQLGEVITKRREIVEKMPLAMLRNIYRALFSVSPPVVSPLVDERSKLVEDIFLFLMKPKRRELSGEGGPENFDCTSEESVADENEEREVIAEEESDENRRWTRSKGDVAYNLLVEKALHGPHPYVVLEKLDQKEIDSYYKPTSPTVGKSPVGKACSAKPAVVHRLRPSYVHNGSGRKLGSIPSIYDKIKMGQHRVINVLHNILFSCPGSDASHRANILEFNGFPLEKNQQFFERKKNYILSLRNSVIKQICNLFCVGTRCTTKEDKVNKFLDFIRSPSERAIKKEKILPTLYSLESRAVLEGRTRKPSGPRAKEVQDRAAKSKTPKKKMCTNHGIRTNIVSRSDERDVRLIDKGIKHRWSWNWLEKEIDGVYVRDIIRKIDKAGAAYCLICCQELQYGHGGFHHLSQHIRSAKHVSNMKAMKENVALPSSPTKANPKRMRSGKDSYAGSTPKRRKIEKQSPPVPQSFLTKLRDFESIRANVENTADADLIELNDLLYLKSCTYTEIREKVLNFTKLPLDQSDPAVQARKTLLYYMNFDIIRKISRLLDIPEWEKAEDPTDLSYSILQFLSTMDVSSPICKRKTPLKNASRRLSDDLGKEKSQARMKFGSNKEPCEDDSHADSGSLFDGIRNPKECEDEEANSMLPEGEVASDYCIQKITASSVAYTHLETGDSFTVSKSRSDDAMPLCDFALHPSDRELTQTIRNLLLLDVRPTTLGDFIRKVFHSYPRFNLNYRATFIKEKTLQILQELHKS